VRLLHLGIADFRNIQGASFEPGPRATLVYGPNGHGKTNLLEAVYFLCTLRPLRATRLSELQRFGQERCRVEGEVRIAGLDRSIAVLVDQGTRTAQVDGKTTRDLEAYFGGISVVAFTPDDLAVVKGAPEHRRRHLDRAVFNRFPAFLAESRTYARVLRSRNRLLREGAATPLIQAFDPPFAEAAARIVSRRRALLSELGERYSQTLGALSGGELRGVLSYRPEGIPAGVGEEDLASAYLEAAEGRLERDRQRGYTGLGPHTDRLRFLLDGRAARSFASQGQQRAMVLAWKIAEIENLRDHLGHQPLLLLDDVSSELDPERNRQLLAYLTAFDGQVILTTTDPGLLLPAAGEDATFYEVREGTFTPKPLAMVRSATGGNHE
jgi:DNA replication and repair protein RecF